MINIDKNILLKEFTTFRVGGPADYFTVVKSAEDLHEALSYARDQKLSVLILGGGSNLVISDAGFRGLVVYIQIPGYKILNESDTGVVVDIASGENWDRVVNTAVQNGWWGIENLSHIPGSMGGFAVQNVGAYGQDASQVVDSVNVVEIATGALKVFKGTECEFGYRASIFNRKFKGQFVIVSTVLKLSKIPKPNLKYDDLAKRFSNSNPSLGEIRSAVIEIRDKKFPFPTGLDNGSAGSFFKNAILTSQEFEALIEKVKSGFSPGISDQAVSKLLEQKSRSQSPDQIKISSALLIDICELKGMQVGGVIVNPPQPLVLKNTGTAKASDVLDLMKKVRTVVFEKTGVVLLNEPELVGFSEDEVEKSFSLN